MRTLLLGVALLNFAAAVAILLVTLAGASRLLLRWAPARELLRPMGTPPRDEPAGGNEGAAH